MGLQGEYTPELLLTRPTIQKSESFWCPSGLSTEQLEGSLLPPFGTKATALVRAA
jgi:hypothetical protein